MKSSKQRSGKAGSSKKKVPSDVSPSTSLPPLVEGQLRCFLQVTISRILWTAHKPPSATFVRLRWWGESTDGTHFFPRDGSQLSQKTIKTTARFAIRCGPKQFTSYLTDMGSLVLEVLTKSDHWPVARAQVPGISRLTLSHPVSGFYTLVSPTSEKLGEIQVSLNLEALTEAYDSSSSGPSTKAPQVATLIVPSRPRSLSAGSGKDSAGSSSTNTPRGKDHLYFQNSQTDKQESLENEVPKTNIPQDSQTSQNPSSQQPSVQTTGDLLSVILERGNKLRDAMVEARLKFDIDTAQALKDTPLPLPKDNILLPSNLPPSPSGMFLQNILHADSSLKPSDDAAVNPDCGLGCPADMDNRAVELLLGSVNTSPLPLWDGDNSLLQSLSGYSSVCGDSDLNDPQYDQSLLENLFYKTPMSDSQPNDIDGEGHATVAAREKQLTQSGPKISVGPDPEPEQSADTVPPGLSAEQLTLLSLIRLCRVTVDSLTVPGVSTPRTGSTKGRPPRPFTSNKCTYFIEYVFPTASSRHDRGRSGVSDVTRAVASKVAGGVVKFHQRSVFPVHLNTATVKQWWETDLTFKIHSRKSSQKKPVPVGKAVYPLCRLLQSKLLSQSVVLPVQSMEGNLDTQGLGPLKVSLELVTDNKNAASEPRKSNLPSRDKSPSQTAHSPQRGSSPRVHVEREEGPSVSFSDSRLHVWTPEKPSREPDLHPGIHISPRKLRHQTEEDPEVLLHALLMVPDGRNFSCGALQAPNLYLNCKLFWCDETARSVVSWGQTNPSFNFSQVTPVALTEKLLERMKNNMMVIEVWLKKGSPGQDQLLGLVKLPLHQFYMSFRDPKISHLLLQAQYPVLGVDCYMPVIDVFSGSCRGNLRVVLAMGRSEQIASLQRTRDEESDSVSHFVRPVHLLDHQPQSQTKAMVAQEHLFVIRVEKVTSLTPLQSTVWGEADCYIQYSFPSQEGDAAAKLDQSLIESSVNLKAFRTTTTLCVPDPLFGHTETHVLVAPDGVPVQRLLLSSLSSRGLSGGGGVQFEVWCRYYYPNVRDQLVARGMLPLSKLCAMVTMQRQQPDESQMFSLPLVPSSDSPSGHQPQPSGLLDVSVRYKHRPVRSENQSSKGAASRVVTLAVQVHRASGLQAAARAVSEQDERFGYFAVMGVNTFVTVQLSFLPEGEKRCTRIAARTFCPEFDHHMEMSCDLLLQRNSGESCSLAEQLEGASAVFTLWNRDNRKAALMQAPKDVMLGVVKIPLADLIHKRTGISGWFGVYAPQDSSLQKSVLVGGLEVSVRFGHHSDRERVIKAAQGVGWEAAPSEEQDDEAAWEPGTRSLTLTVSMPRAWMPVHCLLLPGLQELQRSTYCYFRYKFYDRDAFCSQMKHPTVEAEDGGQATVTFQGSRTVELRSTQPLMWYLREEKLEVQVWVAFKKDKAQRPTDTDRLVGSAFIDLSALAKTPKHKLTLSGVYPLFRRSAADLQGAALRVHITLTPGFIPEEDTQVDSDDQGELLSEEVDEDVPLPSTPKRSHRKSRASRATADITSVQPAELSDDESFPVTVAVDRAMHLSLKSCPLTERSDGSPCCCVSYVTADSAEPVSTSVMGNTDCPVWDHEHECRLSKELLVDPQQYLVFKVWHKGEMERVIGFASVDLSPLLCGFPSVCGWYNIADFSGQCHGQLKVSVTPLRGLQDLRGQRKSVSEKAAKGSPVLFQTLPLTYHTTASYSSFPVHISRFTEQKISSPEHTDRLFAESDSDRHCEHMDKVRLYHQSLQEQTAAQSVCSGSSICDLDPSSSVLFSALRKKLSELDNIQRYFSRKLLTPTFPSVSEQECQPRPEEQSSSDMSQLLLKSSQLVGEVNSIISGMRGHHLETIPSIPESSSASLAAGDSNPQTLLENSLRVAENSSSSHRASGSPEERVRLFPLPTLLTQTTEDTDSEAEEPKTRPNCDVSETEDEEEDVTSVRQMEEDEDDEDEDFEEVVVRPRALNEVTSLTDRTSPWTSVLSEPDLVSLESLEAPEEPDQSQDEGEKLQTLQLQSGEDRQEESDTSEASERDSSDSDREDERTLRAVAKRREVEASRPEEESCEEDSPASPQPPADTHDASCSSDQEDALLHPSEPVKVPNFFLPSHQLEASMRAIRLAPSFSQATCDPERRSPLLPRRVPRQPDNMSPSSKKKETERIAKIFAAHFDD